LSDSQERKVGNGVFLGRFLLLPSFEMREKSSSMSVEVDPREDLLANPLAVPRVSRVDAVRDDLDMFVDVKQVLVHADDAVGARGEKRCQARAIMASRVVAEPFGAARSSNLDGKGVRHVRRKAVDLETYQECQQAASPARMRGRTANQISRRSRLKEADESDVAAEDIRRAFMVEAFEIIVVGVAGGREAEVNPILGPKRLIVLGLEGGGEESDVGELDRVQDERRSRVRVVSGAQERKENHLGRFRLDVELVVVLGGRL
jgi:hypothetical protein